MMGSFSLGARVFLILSIVVGSCASLRLTPGWAQSHPDYNRGVSAQAHGKYQEAARYFLSAAEAGDLHAQMSLAELYTRGEGVPKDEREAAVWYRKAAQNPRAGPGTIGMLGESYEQGRGVPQDYAEAAKWYRCAAEIGEIQKNPTGAMGYWYKLGQLYEQGKGVPQDPSKALKCYHKAAESGLNPAQVRIGRLYEEGRHVTRDYSEAAKWYRKAAIGEFIPEMGNKEAQYRLALLYQQGLGVPKDEAEAVKWFLKAAKQNYAEAQYNLGLAYEAGRGIKKDVAEAAKWYRRAAEKGVQVALEKLGDAERRAVLAIRGPTIPLDTLGPIPDDVRNLLDEINKKYDPVETGGFLVPPGMRDKIQAKGKGISKALQPLLAEPAIDDRLLHRYVALMGATKDPDAIDSLIAVYGRTTLTNIKDECLRSMKEIGSDRAGQFILSTLESDTNPESRFGKVQLLAEMQYEPALPAIAEFVTLYPRGKDWLPIVMFGMMGDKAVPFLIGKIGDRDKNMRFNAIHILGKWLIPQEAARPMEQHFWIEDDPKIRSLILVGLRNTISDLDEQKRVFEQVVAKEKDVGVLKSGQETLARIDQIRAMVVAAKGSKKASPDAFRLEYDAIIGSPVGLVDYDALLNASTAADEPQLKKLREHMYHRRGPRGLNDVEKINRVIVVNRFIDTLK